MPEGEPKQTFSEQIETEEKERVRRAKQRILDLRTREKEIKNQLPGVYKEYREAVCSFLGIEPETRLAKGWAEKILDYSEQGNLDPRIFASLLVATIDGAQRTIDGGGEELPESGTAERAYLEAVEGMREKVRPSLPVYPLTVAVAISVEEAHQNPTMLNRCQHAVYLWITQELYDLESFWWVVVGNPKQNF